MREEWELLFRKRNKNATRFSIRLCLIAFVQHTQRLFVLTIFLVVCFHGEYFIYLSMQTVKFLMKINFERLILIS